MITKEQKAEIITTFIISIPMIIYFIAVTHRNIYLKNHGIETKAVIVFFENRARAMSTYTYLFCVNNKMYKGSLGSYPNKHGYFIFGDIISILYNPDDPEVNKPAIRLYGKKHSKYKKYEDQIQIYNKRDIYKWGMWKSWTDTERLQKFIKTYPVSKEEIPCLPTFYYGE